MSTLCVLLSKHLMVSRMDKGACEHIAPLMGQQSTLGHNFYMPSPRLPTSLAWAIPALQVFRFKCFRHARRSLKGKVFLKGSSCNRSLACASLATESICWNLFQHTGVEAL